MLLGASVLLRMSSTVPDDALHISVEELLCVGVACGHHLGEVNQCQLIFIAHLHEQSLLTTFSHFFMYLKLPEFLQPTLAK